MTDHDFLPVNGHPDDPDCAHRADGTGATYCGMTRDEHFPECRLCGDPVDCLDLCAGCEEEMTDDD